MNGKVDSRDRIVMFIPEYAAYLLKRLEVGQDGKTAYERTKRKKPTVLGIEFGGNVLYKLKPFQKIENQSEMGVWNICGSSEEEQ